MSGTVEGLDQSSLHSQKKHSETDKSRLGIVPPSPASQQEL
jgi:hypothetical protein